MQCLHHSSAVVDCSDALPQVQNQRFGDYSWANKLKKIKEKQSDALIHWSTKTTFVSNVTVSSVLSILHEWSNG